MRQKAGLESGGLVSVKLVVSGRPGMLVWSTEEAGGTRLVAR